MADALLHTPILKHVLGIFGLISASKKSLQKYLRKRGPEGCVVLYVGGMAELFLSSHDEEKLYLLNRKGFIKLALQEGVDIVPIYLFGNTSVLSVWNNRFITELSRKVRHEKDVICPYINLEWKETVRQRNNVSLLACCIMLFLLSDNCLHHVVSSFSLPFIVIIPSLLLFGSSKYLLRIHGEDLVSQSLETARYVFDEQNFSLIVSIVSFVLLNP